MNPELIERLKRADASAVEEAGHALLPFVQAAVLAPAFALRDPAAVLQAFREEVARAAAEVSPQGFGPAVVAACRARALPATEPDGPQREALAKLALLEPLGVAQREVAIARFVERLPADALGAQFGVDGSAIGAILARAASLLAGPAPRGDWGLEASLLDPNALPVPQFLALENVLSALAIDVTALEAEPLRPAGTPSVPVPVLKPGYEAHAPVEHYPSKVKTQAANDLPAEVSSFVPPAQPPPRASAPSVPSVVVALEHTPPVPARPLQREDQTEPQARALTPPADLTGQTRSVLPKVAVQDEETNVKGQPLAVGPEQTEPRAHALAAGVDQTTVGLAAVGPRLPLHRRVPPAWYWGSAALCGVLGVALYFGLVRFLEVQIRRPWTMVPVIVVTRDFEEGTILQSDMLAIRAIPEQNATQSVVKPEHVPEAIGKRLEFPMQAGDPLLWAQFDPSMRHKRFDVIKHGRAYSVPVTELKSVGGQIDPLDEVDLLMVFTALPGQPKLGHTNERALTLLQKVRVLSVGKVTTLNVGRVQKRYTDLTLMLVPEEVEVLSLAMRTGELTASMRNLEDTDTIERGETNLQTLMSGERQRRLQNKRSQVIDVVRGKK